MFFTIAAVLKLAVAISIAQPTDLPEALEQATKSAVAKVAPSLVQIQTVGGLEMLAGGGRGPGTLRGQGPTTGVIVSADGYIISSSFNFVHKPSAITVGLQDGKLLSAKVVAHDHTRMLTLLKVEANGLPMPTAAAKKELKIGQWAIALGKSWSAGNTSPSISVGIVSALERMYGKAVQTDAKVSPVNYGGPLIDLEGRIIGILSPLSPRADGETAGLEWYDSGIGFAVPYEDIERILPKLKEGKDLNKGVLGVNLKGTDQFSGTPTVANVKAETTAAKAGIQVDDQIIEIDGKPIARQSQLQHMLGPKYVGDAISLKIKRGDKTIELPNLTLTAEPSSHLQAFLGIVPMRDHPEPFVEVRYVFPKSGADVAGIKVGDRIVKVEGRPIRGRDGLLALLSRANPGMPIKLEVQRKEGGKTDSLTATLGTMTDAIPESLPDGSKKKALAPPASLPEGLQNLVPPSKGPKPAEKAKETPTEKKQAKTGHFSKADATTGRRAWVYVPENYDPNVSHALVVWIHSAGNPYETELMQIWQEFCKEQHIILLGPQAENRTGWMTSEVDFIKADVRGLLEEYTIDRQRIVMHGQGDGGDLAMYLAFDDRSLVRGAAVVGGSLANAVKENVAHQRLAFFLTAGARDPALAEVRATKEKLTGKKYAVVFREVAEQGAGYPADAGLLREMVRWIDSLDRL